MELFIRIVDGQPFEHPIFGDNFRQAFPDVDTNNLPPEFAHFERLEAPVVGVYEIYEGATYERDGEIFKDVHHVRAMTDVEKLEKQDAVKAMWSEQGYSSWIFDEATCSFIPPVSLPADGKPYRWDETTTSWIEFAAT
jgi:hypothetical protein